jgi:hypothetical protein
MITLREALQNANGRHEALGHFDVSDLSGFHAVVHVGPRLKLQLMIGVSEGEREFIGVKKIALLGQNGARRVWRARKGLCKGPFKSIPLLPGRSFRRNHSIAGCPQSVGPGSARIRAPICKLLCRGHTQQRPSTSSVLARSNDDTQHFSVSQIGSTAAASFISRIWQPRGNDSAADGAVNFGINMASNAGVNVVREFLPVVTRHIFHNHRQ